MYFVARCKRELFRKVPLIELDWPISLLALHFGCSSRYKISEYKSKVVFCAAGAVTWQLPYEVEGRLSFELERTLCPDDTADAGDATSDCGRYRRQEPKGRKWLILTTCRVLQRARRCAARSRCTCRRRARRRCACRCACRAPPCGSCPSPARAPSTPPR